ncbi:hypothetical protein HMPREF9004_0417 [Schaalia cardiffensis F0333]|uniref:Uncharacterized protein n=1 Tax=Schaalia cardiffensis F0333 TaxID=888050 RepID=N6X5W6_9ACTO|nr:hypothetical protein HMPREF9004_0417 [Schaalia cardiffensis F0333]
MIPLSLHFNRPESRRLRLHRTPIPTAFQSRPPHPRLDDEAPGFGGQ